MEGPSVGGAAFNRVIKAFTNGNIVKDFSADTTQNLGQVLVEFLLRWVHAFASFIQGFLGSIELLYVDFAAGTGNHSGGITEGFERIEFAL